VNASPASYPLTQWPVLAAVVGVLMLVVWLVSRWQAAQMSQLRELLDMTKPADKKDGQSPGGRDPGASGAWQAPQLCAPGCREDVVAALNLLRSQLEKFADEMRQSTRELNERLVVVREVQASHAAQIASLQQASRRRRSSAESDSDRP